jgi:hypothetical protein
MLSSRVVWCTLLVGCLITQRAHSAEPVTSSQPGPPAASETTPKQTPAGAALSSEKPQSTHATGVAANAAPPEMVHPGVHAPAVRDKRPFSGTPGYSARPAGVPTARTYALHTPGETGVARRPGAAAATARGMGATTLAANANRPSSGVFGATGRSIASLKSSAGNGVVGGPHVARAGMIGGPANGRSVSKAGIDGSAFHHRS